MPRRPLLLTSQFPYHVTARVNDKNWFDLPLERCWYHFAKAFLKINSKYRTQLFSFVLMSNHFHLAMTTPLSNLGDTMRDFLTQVSKSMQKEAGHINHLFGARYKWSVLDNPYSVAYVTKYIFRNPIRSGLSKRVEDYPYSSLNRIDSKLPLSCGIGDLWTQVPTLTPALLEWLNRPTPKELEQHITLGLRRERFGFSKSNSQQNTIRRLKEYYNIENGR